ncbi:MAG: acyltransferase domain-containing protein, partial [Planctomycetia bacterium]
NTGSVAFVYPGSGADFVGMGREYAVYFPEILARQENESTSLRAQWSPEYYWQNNLAKQPLPHQKIMAQVSYGCLATGLLASMDLKPDVSIGYSLGESSALIANQAWFDRDGLWRMLETSSLFRLDLVGPRRAIACSWELPAGVVPDWIVGLVERSEQEIRQVLEAFDKVYLLIINSARESVIGGDSNQVRAVVAKLGCRLIPLSSDTAAVHCEAARPIADAYRKFHTLPTQVPENLLVYSAAFGGPYEVTKVAAAEAITGLAVDTMDFKAVVEAAYQDGARIFVEVGPGASCSRIIGNILADKNHLARSISTNRGSELSAFLRT